MFGGGGGNKLEDLTFQLKFTSKQLQRDANKCSKAETTERSKLKTALQKGQNDNAQIYAQNVIRQRNQRTRYLTMAAKIDAIASRVDIAAKTNTLSTALRKVVVGMDSAMKSMDLERMSGLMDNFEKQFENLDIKTSVMEGAMDNTTTLFTPTSQVDSLMQEVADEAGIDLKMELPTAASSTITSTEPQAQAEQDELSQRLAKLRNL